MSKRIKILLIVLGILIVAAAVMWFLTQGGVSADVVGTTNETASDDSSTADIVKIDDNVAVVSPGQTLSYTLTVDTKKMFEQMSGLNEPTETQFNDWKNSNKYDKLFLNAWLANGKSTANDSWILANPNFSVPLPELRYPLSEIQYVATAKVPTNIDLTGNKVVNTARIVRRPCHVATTAEIANSIIHPPKLKTTSLVCPMENRVRIAQNGDMDILSYKTNTTDLGIVTYDVADKIIAADESTSFTVQYKNLSNQIAGGARLRILYPENTFLIQDSSIKPAVKETIDGKKYDVYYINLGDLMPTVNGTNRTDAATIAAIKTSLKASLEGNTNTALTKEINDAIKVVDQYAAGTKNLDQLLTAVKIPFDTATKLQSAAELVASTTYIYVRRPFINIPIRVHPPFVSPGFGSGTLTSLTQALGSVNNLATSASTPATPLKLKYFVKALSQTNDATGVNTYVELLTNSTDADTSNNTASRSTIIVSPSMYLKSNN